MAASEAILQVLSDTFPRFNGTNSSLCNVNGVLSIESAVKSRRKRSLVCHQGVTASRIMQKGLRVSEVEGTNEVFLRKFESNRSDSVSCKCQPAKSASGITLEEESRMRFKDEVDRPTSLSLNGIACLPSISELNEKFESNAKLGATGTSVDKLHDSKKKLIDDEAWSLLWASMAHYCNNPIRTIAANDPSSTNILNYDQVSTRDFMPSGIAFLLKGEYDIVRNFLRYTLQLQSWEKTMDCHSPGQGLMPASFKVRTVPLDGDDPATEDVLAPDFGEAAIGRVAPIDSALLCAREMLAPEDASADLIQALSNRLVALSFHIREYYWIDMRKLNEIYQYMTREYSFEAVNKLNIYPDQISSWLVEFMPGKEGYFIGNLQLAHMEFCFFSLGNLWSIVSSLGTLDQSHAILDLIEAKWEELVAEMPFKICYPALEGEEWHIITGCDPKNTYCTYA